MLTIVLARFPYLDSGNSKLRPCLLIAVEQLDSYSVSILAYISSQKPTENKESDYTIDFDMATGLKKTSYLRLHKLISIDTSQVQGQIGFVDNSQEQTIKFKLKNLFNL